MQVDCVLVCGARMNLNSLNDLRTAACSTLLNPFDCCEQYPNRLQPAGVEDEQALMAWRWSKPPRGFRQPIGATSHARKLRGFRISWPWRRNTSAHGPACRPSTEDAVVTQFRQLGGTELWVVAACRYLSYLRAVHVAVCPLQYTCVCSWQLLQWEVHCALAVCNIELMFGCFVLCFGATMHRVGCNILHCSPCLRYQGPFQPA